MIWSPGAYVIQDEGPRRYIRCLKCHNTSYNEHDIAQRYCDFCHEFHLDSQGLKENMPRDSKK